MSDTPSLNFYKRRLHDARGIEQEAGEALGVRIDELESALAARDALRDKTVRATALRDAAETYAADGYVTGEHTPGFFGIGNWEGEPDAWLRARADQEEGKNDQ